MKGKRRPPPEVQAAAFRKSYFLPVLFLAVEPVLLEPPDLAPPDFAPPDFEPADFAAVDFVDPPLEAPELFSAVVLVPPALLVADLVADLVAPFEAVLEPPVDLVADFEGFLAADFVAEPPERPPDFDEPPLLDPLPPLVFTVSRRVFAAAKETTVLAGMSISRPVCGLRPLRAARSFDRNLPKPGIETCFPACTASAIAPLLASKIASKTRAAAALLVCVFSAIRSMRSALFICAPGLLEG